MRPKLADDQLGGRSSRDRQPAVSRAHVVIYRRRVDSTAVPFVQMDRFVLCGR